MTRHQFKRRSVVVAEYFPRLSAAYRRGPGWRMDRRAPASTAIANTAQCKTRADGTTTSTILITAIRRRYRGSTTAWALHSPTSSRRSWLPPDLIDRRLCSHNRSGEVGHLQSVAELHGSESPPKVGIYVDHHYVAGSVSSASKDRTRRSMSSMMGRTASTDLPAGSSRSHSR